MMWKVGDYVCDNGLYQPIYRGDIGVVEDIMPDGENRFGVRWLKTVHGDRNSKIYYNTEDMKYFRKMSMAMAIYEVL